eukprot:1353359-Heterocapsa_arctica.AAC.1
MVDHGVCLADDIESSSEVADRRDICEQLRRIPICSDPLLLLLDPFKAPEVDELYLITQLSPDMVAQVAEHRE